MIDQKKRAYHFETSSLLQLKAVLSEAEKISPPRVRHEQIDINEELALKLIASMRKNYRKAMSLRGAVGRVARSVFREGHIETKATTLAPGVICLANHAGEQSPPNLEIAPGSCHRNDKKVEP